MSIDTERVQRALNEHKRQYLADHYGARFPEVRTKMSPQLEGEWLDSVAEIEAACAIAGEVSVREYLRNPTFRSLGEIVPGELRVEVEVLLDYLMENHIIVTFAGEVTDECAYRFLSAELMEMQIENVRFPIWYTVFLYHPVLGAKRLGVSMRNFSNAVGGGSG